MKTIQTLKQNILKAALIIVFSAITIMASAGTSFSGIVLAKPASFTAVLSTNNTRVDLRWSTSSEKNTSHFVIEKSTDGNHFSDAGIVFAMGNASGATNYFFSDNVINFQAGIFYYRLRSVDINGKNEYSQTRLIRISKQSDHNISISTFPNPVINEMRVTIPSSWQAQKVAYEFFNANGQSALKTEKDNSNQTETLNVNSLAPGFYIVKVSCNGETAMQKMIKQ